MPELRGLTLVVAGVDAERFHSALAIAAAHAAAGGRSRVFLEGKAVTLLATDAAPGDAERTASGLPSLAELRAEAQGLGVGLIACQGGMGLTRLTIDRLGPGVEAGGLVGLMASLGDDRLVVL